MRIFYQNVNRIRSKLNDVYLSLLNDDYDIVCLTETNFDSGIYTSEVIDDRYVVFRRDRESTTSSKQSGGGVLLAIKKHFHVTRHQDMETSLEDLWITMRTGKAGLSLAICLVYLPDYLKIDEFRTWIDKCSNNLLADTSDYRTKTIILGDFNLPNLQWSPDPASSYSLINTAPLDSKSELLFNLMALGNLSQCNNICNANNRILDLFLTDYPNLTLTECDAVSRVDRHHPAFVAELLDVPKPLVSMPKKTLNYRKCDLAKCNQALDCIDWPMVLSNSDVNVDLATFYTTLNDIIKQNTPLKRVGDNRHPLWFSESLKACIDEKNKVHRRYKKYQNPRDYDEFQMLRTRSKKLIKDCYKSFLSSVENSLCDTTKLFFTFVKSKKANNSLPETMYFGNKSARGGLEVCNLFSEYFASVFEKDDIDHDGDCEDLTNVGECNNTLANMTIPQDAVRRKLLTVNVNKGAGPDGIPPYFIQSCAGALSIPLTIIFNKSFSTSTFPNNWKLAYVVPIHKSGDISNCGNYRPISILSCFAKVLESFVFDVLYSHVKPRIVPEQHGFVKGKSTVSNLLEYTNYLCTAFNDRCQVDTIYTDFRKAFDKVNHRILCCKLSLYGVHGNFLRWVESYIKNRSQIIALKGHLSSPAGIPSGIPQGSLLGPLFFIIFINDLVIKFNSPCLLYADDLKVFTRVRTQRDCTTLQEDLNTLSHWCADNRMFLAADKCFVITMTRNHNPVLSDYTIGDVTLQRKHEARDLGVIFDDKLSLNQHCSALVKKCNQLLGFISRVTKSFKKSESLILLYNALVRSRLEYASVIWSPFYKTHIDHVESVQKRFLRMLCARLGLRRAVKSYDKRCERFSLESLESRRRLQDLIHLHKIINGAIVTSTLSEINFQVPSRSVRIPRPFFIPTCRSNISANNPMLRMCRRYNEVVATEDDVPDIYHVSLPCFKYKMRKILKQV